MALPTDRYSLGKHSKLSKPCGRHKPYFGNLSNFPWEENDVMLWVDPGKEKIPVTVSVHENDVALWLHSSKYSEMFKVKWCKPWYGKYIEVKIAHHTSVNGEGMMFTV